MRQLEIYKLTITILSELGKIPSVMIWTSRLGHDF
jgi:hypothetical protein